MRFGQYIVLAGAMTFVAACKPSPDPTPSPEPQATEVAPAATPSVEATSSAPVAGGLNENSSSLHGNVQDLHMQVNLAADAMFDFDSAVLKATAAPELQRAADAIRSKGKGTVTIVHLLTEKELGERLGEFADDVAVLRRYLVDFGLLIRTRSGSTYSLPPQEAGW